MEQNLKEILDEILNEVEQELEEATTTGDVAGYNTPNAFSDKGKSDKKKKKKIATSLGYSVVDGDVDNISEAIKGRNNKTGESFGMVIGSDKQGNNGYELTVRKTYNSRISAYGFIFDKDSNLTDIRDYGYSLDGKFPDMKGHASSTSVRPNKRETITQIAKITSPAFAKKIYQHVQKNNKMDESVNEGRAKNDLKHMARFGNGDDRVTLANALEFGGVGNDKKDQKIMIQMIDKLSDKEARIALRNVERERRDESVNEGKVHFEKKLKSGNIFQVIDRDTKGMRGTQDKFSMQIVDKKGKVVKHIGSHPSLSGAKKYSNSVNEISAKKGLEQVIKGNTKDVEGIKVSKEMAQAMLDWFNSSPYGRKYPKAKNSRLHISIGIMLSFGLERYAKHKGAKEELKYLKSIKESVNEAISRSYYLEKYGANDEFSGKKVAKYSKFDKNKIKSDFNRFAKTLKDEEELHFMGVNNDKKRSGDEYLFSVVNQDGENRIEITKGSRTFYKKFKAFKLESVNESKVKRPVNRWLELKNDETMHAHKKMAMGLKELKYQLRETEKFFNWYNKIKTMNELDSNQYWKRTNKHIYSIKEKLINIAKTIQEIEK
jgi:hypothetical protein